MGLGQYHSGVGLGRLASAFLFYSGQRQFWPFLSPLCSSRDRGLRGDGVAVLADKRKSFHDDVDARLDQQFGGDRGVDTIGCRHKRVWYCSSPFDVADGDALMGVSRVATYSDAL